MAGPAVAGRQENGQGHRRIWVGRDDDGVAKLALMDAAGHQRLLLEVPTTGAPSLTFLDGDGRITQRSAPTASSNGRR